MDRGLFLIVVGAASNGENPAVIRVVAEDFTAGILEQFQLGRSQTPSSRVGGLGIAAIVTEPFQHGPAELVLGDFSVAPFWPVEFHFRPRQIA